MACTVAGCAKPNRTRTSPYCDMHYTRWYTHRDTSMVKTRRGVENKTTAHATRVVTVRDLEWAAGFMEGEGCFHKGSGVAGNIIVSAVQVNKEPIQRIADLFGGTLKQYTYRKTRLLWKWSAHGGRARGIALTLYSLLSERRQGQIRNAIS